MSAKPMDRKAELEARRDELNAELSSIKTELRQIAEAACPAKIGSIVRCRGKEYLVVGIDDPEWGWLFANPRLADGSWGKARRRIHGDYEILDDSPPTGGAG